jgi:hypothetical protein
MLETEMDINDEPVLPSRPLTPPEITQKEGVPKRTHVEVALDALKKMTLAVRHSTGPAYSQVLASRSVGIPINTQTRESESSMGTYSCRSESGILGHKYLWHRSEGLNTCITYWFYSLDTTLHSIHGGYSIDKA